MSPCLSLKPLVAALAVLAMASAAPLHAEPGDPPAIVPAFRATELSALARIRSSDQTSGGCTAVLIAPARALTASHCADGSADGTDRPRVLVFAPGRGADQTRVTVTATQVHPGNLAPALAPLTLETARFDLSVLQLAEPIPPEIATPLPVAPADPSRQYGVFGYVNSNDGPLHGHEGCQIQVLAAGAIASDCTVQGGQSGGALVAETVDGWALVGILVAQIPPSTSPLRSLAAPLDPEGFPALAEALDIAPTTPAEDRP